MKRFKKSVLFAAAAVCLMCAACKDNDDNPPEEVRCDALVPESVRMKDYAVPTAEDADELADKAVKALPAAMEAAVPVIQEALGNVTMPAAEKSVLARMAVSDLGGLVEEFNEAWGKLSSDIAANGSGNLSFNKEPGTITDLPPYLNLSIPALSVNASGAMSQDSTVQKQKASGNCNISASGSVDLTDDEFNLYASKIKSVAGAISLNASVSNFEAKIDLTSNNVAFSGSLNAGYKAESKVLFVIDGVAGILRATIDYSVKMDGDDMNKLIAALPSSGENDEESSEVTENPSFASALGENDGENVYDDIVENVDNDALMNALKDYITVKAVIDVLDINGNLIKTCKETDKIEEILELFGSFGAVSVE